MPIFQAETVDHIYYMNESGYTFSVDEHDRHSDFVYNILLATIQIDIILVSIVFIVILFTLLFYSQLTGHTLIIFINL